MAGGAGGRPWPPLPLPLPPASPIVSVSYVDDGAVGKSGCCTAGEMTFSGWSG